MKWAIHSFFNSAKDPLGLGISRLVSAMLSGLFWFFLADLLSKTDYGELGFLISIATVGHAISLLGLNQVIVIFGAKNENIFYPSYALGLISATVVGISSFFLTGNIFLSFIVITLMIFTLYTSQLNAKKNFSSYSFHFLLQRTLNLVFAIMFYFYFGINGILFGLVLSNLPSFKSFYYFIKNRTLSLAILKPKFHFMMHNYFINLNWFLLWFGDKLLIGTLFGFSSLASYQLASQYLLFLNTIPLSLSVYLLPHEAQGIQNKKLKLISIIFSVVITIVSLLVLPFAVEFLLPDYVESILIMQILSLAIIPLLISSILESEFLGREKSNVVLFASGIQVGLYFILIIIINANNLGLFEIGLAFVVSSIARTGINLISKYHLYS